VAPREAPGVELSAVVQTSKSCFHLTVAIARFHLRDQPHHFHQTSAFPRLQIFATFVLSWNSCGGPRYSRAACATSNTRRQRP
jgi:hypothetical protein